MDNPGHYDEYPELTRADEERERAKKADTTMNTGAASLLPCPFCGEGACLHIEERPDNHRYPVEHWHAKIECGMCPVTTEWTVVAERGAKKADSVKVAEVVATWNRRATSTPQADAASSEEAYVAKRLSEALADVYMTIIGDDEPEADDGSNVIERVKKAAQVLRLEVDLYRSQAEAAIAAGGAQEPDVFKWLETELSAISCRYHGDPSYDHDAYWMKDRVMKLIADARKAFALPREAATVPDGNAVYAALDRRAQSYISREVVEDVLIAVRALLAASNGEQA
jgi:uncharacterized protein (DUF2384 family)